ncbi:MAG: zinc ribbon domain-containing protein [Anaerovoracaceae bacterium]
MSEKLIKCKACGTEMASSAKACPKCGAKNKKPIFKRISFWILIVLLVLMVGAYTSCAGTFKSAKVTFANNELKASSAKEVVNLENENRIKWEQEYFNATVTITGKVEDIGSKTKIVNGGNLYASVRIADKGNKGWTFCFYTDEDSWSKYRDIVQDLEVGDTVTATGKITETMFTTGVELHRITDFQKVK